MEFMKMHHVNLMSMCIKNASQITFAWQNVVSEKHEGSKQA